MAKNTLWGMASFNYELVKSVKGCEDYEALVPEKVYGSRAAAANAAAAEINEYLAEVAEDETDGELKLDDPNSKPLTESLEWLDVHRRHTGDDQKRWRTREQDDMNVYVIFSLELIE